ncbi:hypothetical protein C5748_12260 [Phyllobacterium phragmitis]|uniref:DUF4926 domain-containing protein n=1 Tax=Phyllobacterium phragmitis TaxID=2670329 RepID=A0A2S9IRR5_9HYPH|nr:hypothetical protein C5748_12260 [Phyllobacterium phragmitis]
MNHRQTDLKRPLLGPDPKVVGEHRIVVLPVGTVVSVVLVFGDPNDPEAYEIEAFLESRGEYALATVEADDIK